ncbi:unnamed protein product [Thelazia callipaeda]|uniref:PAS domain-containing protein n=1 Tax=Thelazia callipaeda TaxID=103827 RepID=A0A0N5CX01_THECL|nr:unnamed protein product [Thelazia callipaeda]
MLHQHHPAQASANQPSLQSTKSIRRKRFQNNSNKLIFINFFAINQSSLISVITELLILQHYIRQIKRLVVERIPSTDPGKKLGTVDAFEKAIELLRTTPTFVSGSTNPSLSPPHSWSDSPLENLTHTSDESWIPNVDFARRHIFSVDLSLPDGRIVDFQKVTTKELSNAYNLNCDTCFLDFITPFGRQALLAGAYNNSTDKKRILTRFIGEREMDRTERTNARLVLPVSDDHESSPTGSPSQMIHQNENLRIKRISSNGAIEMLCEYKRTSNGGPISMHIHALQLESAFGPSKILNTCVFTTRHSNSCTLTYLDSSAANYIGHLPGEVINQSILYLLHPYDMVQFKQIHATLSAQRDEIVRQCRLRWIAFNGSIIHTNSEWFAFWNPWSHKVESIIGRHTLNEQPIGNANVLAEPRTPRLISPLDELTVRHIESEITAILNKESTLLIKEKFNSTPALHQKISDSLDLKLSGTHLGAYIDNLVETFVINASSPANKYLASAVDDHRSTVNPTDLSLSNSCSTIPLTYNQINCLENVHRLLKSQQHIGTIAAVSTVTDSPPENILSSKLRPSEDSRSPLPVPDQEDTSRLDTVAPAMPLTRELLQQHTRKWEQEYRDTWKKRLGLKRSIRQAEFVVPVSSKVFRENTHRSILTQNTPMNFSSSRSEYWQPMNKDEYYRSLAPNPPPPPGKNFQITSVPLPPPLPVEEHRSAFVPLPPSVGSNTENTLKLPRDLSQPINLSLSKHIHQTSHPLLVAPVVVSNGMEQSFIPNYQQNHCHQQPHRSVIKTALTKGIIPFQQQQQQQYLMESRLPSVIGNNPRRYLSTGNMDMNVEWCPSNDYSGMAFEEVKQTCAARLMNMAQRAQQQKQLEHGRLQSPLANSAVKEATDALMLLQETSF